LLLVDRETMRDAREIMYRENSWVLGADSLELAVTELDPQMRQNFDHFLKDVRNLTLYFPSNRPFSEPQHFLSSRLVFRYLITRCNPEQLSLSLSFCHKCSDNPLPTAMTDIVWHGLVLLINFLKVELRDRKFKDFFVSVAGHSENYCDCAEHLEPQVRELEKVVMGKGYDSSARHKYKRGHMLEASVEGVDYCAACGLRG
jgi:hypothetical protein